MTYFELKKKLDQYPLFKLEDIFKWFPRDDRRSLIVQLSNWVKKGHLERLKRGVYKFADYEIEDPFILANFFIPSYISCETALNCCGLTPDIPFSIVSVTTKKTSTIQTKNYGTFIYHKIKPDLFFGYKSIDVSAPYSYKIAEPEKALFDFLYLQSFKESFHPENFLQETRLDIKDDFKWKNLKKWEKLVPENNKKFHLAIKKLFKKYQND